MRARGIAPKLRTFNPALQCYCDTGDIKRVRSMLALLCAKRVGWTHLLDVSRRKQAVTLELEIRKAGISMSELEYTMMLEAMSRSVGR